MKAKEYCLCHPLVATTTAVNGLAIHGINYGTEDCVYFQSGMMLDESKRSFHRVKIHYPRTGRGRPYFMAFRQRVYLDECCRIR